MAENGHKPLTIGSGGAILVENMEVGMPDEQVKTTSPKAIWSLVLGIVALTCLGCIAGVPAIICGHMALAHIKKSAGLFTGDGMAIAGLIMGYLSLAMMIVVIPILAAIAIPSFVKAREAAQVAMCMNNLRLVQNAVQQAALAKNLDGEAAIGEGDIVEYLKDSKLPVCPAQGVYSLGKVSEEPRCSVHGTVSNPVHSKGEQAEKPDATKE